MNSPDPPHLRRYFEHSRQGVDVLQDGLVELSFGEFLVELRTISRFQLFRALQLQDANPGIRLGECIAALGYARYATIERHLAIWRNLTVVTVH